MNKADRRGNGKKTAQGVCGRNGGFMVSIKEVAKHAGQFQVSKVLNGYPNVSEETKEKGTDAIKELNYSEFPSALSIPSSLEESALVLDRAMADPRLSTSHARYLARRRIGERTECGSRDKDLL